MPKQKKAHSGQSKKIPKCITLTTADILKSKTFKLKWKVDRVIGEGHTTLLIGDRGAGKTLTAWATGKASTSTKLLFDKFKVTGSHALIIDEEAPENDFNGFVSMIFGDDDKVKFWYKQGFRWDSEEWKQRLIQMLEEDPQLEYIVVDNLNATKGDWNLETSNEDVGKLRAVINALKQVRPTLVVIIIHHFGKDSSKGARGPRALEDLSDTLLELYRISDKPFQFIVKQRPRKRPVYANPFILELQVEPNKLWLKYLGEVENVEVPSRDAIDIYEYLIDKDTKKTVAEIHYESGEMIGKQPIRNALNELTRNGALRRDTAEHGLGKYLVNPKPPDNLYNKMLSVKLNEDKFVNTPVQKLKNRITAFATQGTKKLP